MEYKMETQNLNVWYGDNHVLKDVDLKILENQVTALIGPSGCGKSTLLMTLNRLIELIDGARVEGRVLLDGEGIYNHDVDVTDIRRRVGMVFQKPNPLPKSIYENVAYGPRIHGVRDKKKLDRIVKKSLQAVGLWDEVHDRLNDSAFNLSVGQQQRLCIARALAVKPEVLLMDEPCSALDPTTTRRIEEVIRALKTAITVVIVTHNMHQAMRVSDYTAFLYMGRIAEYGETEQVFENPKNPLTRDYINGRFG